MSRGWPVAIVVAVAALITRPVVVHACSMNYPPLETTMRTADVVVEGRYEGMRLFPVPAHRFSVMRVWKGPLRNHFYFPLYEWPPWGCTDVSLTESSVVWGKTAVFGLAGSNDPYRAVELEPRFGAGTPAPSPGVVPSAALGLPAVVLALVLVWLFVALPGHDRFSSRAGRGPAAVFGMMVGGALGLAWWVLRGSVPVHDAAAPLALNLATIALATGTVFAAAMLPRRLPRGRWGWVISSGLLCLAMAVWTFEPLVMVAEYTVAVVIGTASGAIAYAFQDRVTDMGQRRDRRANAALGPPRPPACAASRP